MYIYTYIHTHIYIYIYTHVAQPSPHTHPQTTGGRGGGTKMGRTAPPRVPRDQQSGYIYIYRYVYVYVYIYICIYIYMYMYMYMYVYIYICGGHLRHQVSKFGLQPPKSQFNLFLPDQSP